MPVRVALVLRLLDGRHLQGDLRAGRESPPGPAASFTSFATVAVTSSPTLFLCERISASVVAENTRRRRGCSEPGPAPEPRRAPEPPRRAPRRPVSASAWASARAWASVLASGAGAGAWRPWRVSAAGPVVQRRRVVSTGASCRSRFRLSADATSDLSPRPHAASGQQRERGEHRSRHRSPPRGVTCRGFATR